MTGKEKAAVLLSILGPQKAARILRKLPDDISNSVAARVATLPVPAGDQIRSLLGELSQNLLPAPANMAAAGDKPGKRSTAKAQPEISKVDLEKLPLEERLNYIHPKKVVEIIKLEPPRIQNFVLSILNEDRAKEVGTLLNINRKVKLDRISIDALPIQDDFKSIIITRILAAIEETNGNH